MTCRYDLVLFDLDGTIANSAPGIIGSIGSMLEKMGRDPMDEQQLRAMIGPPLLESFEKIGLSTDEVQIALAIYREEYLSEHLRQTPIFDGIADVIRTLHATGVPLGVATSKPEFPASVILDHANLTPNFRVISGASIDEIRSAKADVVAEALRRFEMIGFRPSNPVLIGDRIHDVEGGAAHGVPVIFADWGYGADVEAEHAIARAARPSELLDLLLES